MRHGVLITIAILYQLCSNFVKKVDQGGVSLQRDQYINKSIEGDKVC